MAFLEVELLFPRIGYPGVVPGATVEIPDRVVNIDATADSRLKKG